MRARLSETRISQIYLRGVSIEGIMRDCSHALQRQSRTFRQKLLARNKAATIRDYPLKSLKRFDCFVKGAECDASALNQSFNFLLIGSMVIDSPVMHNFRPLVCCALFFGLNFFGLGSFAQSQTPSDKVAGRTAAQQQFIEEKKKYVGNFLRDNIAEEAKDPFLKKQNDVVRLLLDEKTTPEECAAKVVSLLREAYAMSALTLLTPVEASEIPGEAVEVKSTEFNEVSDMPGLLYLLKDRTDGFYEFTKLIGQRAEMSWDEKAEKTWNTDPLLKYELYAFTHYLNESNLNQYEGEGVSFYDLHDEIESLRTRYAGQQRLTAFLQEYPFERNSYVQIWMRDEGMRGFTIRDKESLNTPREKRFTDDPNFMLREYYNDFIVDPNNKARFLLAVKQKVNGQRVQVAAQCISWRHQVEERQSQTSATNNADCSGNGAVRSGSKVRRELLESGRSKSNFAEARRAAEARA